jgi:hypothetical protein
MPEQSSAAAAAACAAVNVLDDAAWKAVEKGELRACIELPGAL